MLQRENTDILKGSMRRQDEMVENGRELLNLIRNFLLYVGSKWHQMTGPKNVNLSGKISVLILEQNYRMKTKKIT